MTQRKSDLFTAPPQMDQASHDSSDSRSFASPLKAAVSKNYVEASSDIDRSIECQLRRERQEALLDWIEYGHSSENQYLLERIAELDVRLASLVS